MQKLKDRFEALPGNPERLKAVLLYRAQIFGFILIFEALFCFFSQESFQKWQSKIKRVRLPLRRRK